MPPPTGNPSIDGLMPVFRLVDHAAESAPALMWLAWAALAAVLASLPALASRARSVFLGVVLILPGTAVLFASFILFSMLMGDLTRIDPFVNVAVSLAVSGALVLLGWRFGGGTPGQVHSADLAFRVARPALVFCVFLLAIAVAPLRALTALPVLAGMAIFLVEVALTHLMLDALRRISTSPSTSDLLRFGCVAPVYVVPDGSLSFVAVAAGLTHGSSAVFVQQHLEDALNSSDPVAMRRATHVLAHEAGHVVQQHGLWRTLTISLIAMILPAVVGGTGPGSLAFVTGVSAVCVVVIVLAGEWAAERFAARMTETA